MNPPAGSTPRDPEVSTDGKRRACVFALVALAILVSAVLVFFIGTSRPNEKFVWLTPAELVGISRPGPFTRLKFKVMDLTAPLWRWYWSSRPQITIGSSLLTLPAATEPAGLGPPNATHASGMRAWILPPTEWNTCRQQFKTMPGATVLGTPVLSTSDGGRGQVFTGNSVSVAGKFLRAGITLDLTPQITRGSVSLLIGATATEAFTPDAGDALAIRTNFAAACRVTVPNGGGLLIESANPTPGNGTNYWLMVSPVRVDAKGRPIQP